MIRVAKTVRPFICSARPCQTLICIDLVLSPSSSYIIQSYYLNSTEACIVLSSDTRLNGIRGSREKNTHLPAPPMADECFFLSVSLLYHSITRLNYILSRIWTQCNACLSNGRCNRCIPHGIALLPHIHKNLYSLTFCPSRRTLPMSSSFSHTKSPEWFWISIFHFCSCLIRPPHSATHSTCIIIY